MPWERLEDRKAYRAISGDLRRTAVVDPEGQVVQKEEGLVLMNWHDIYGKLLNTLIMLDGICKLYSIVNFGKL